MENGDHKVGGVLSAVVLVAAAIFTANVYSIYMDDVNAVAYEDADSSYSQAANIFLSLKNVKSELASTTDASATTTSTLE